MSVLPTSFRGSTTLNPSITSYDALALRVRRLLGAPLVQVEVSDEQLYENINISIEYFTKYAGYTEEYLVFNSNLYKKGVGIKVDQLINTTPETYSSQVSGLSAGYDYDINSYRRVVDCFSFDQGESTGINTLFTLEQAMAQQIYSSYMIGNFGFDLISWEILKGFIDTRNKVLSLTPYFRFNAQEQVLQLIPEPTEDNSYIGIVGCYLERPIKNLVSERWVQKYTTALTKITVGTVRGKFSNTGLFGGGTVNYNDFLQQGIKERDELEQELKEQHLEVPPAAFFIG